MAGVRGDCVGLNDCDAVRVNTKFLGIKQGIAVSRGHVPVAAADKEVEIDEFVFQGDVFGFVEAGYFRKLTPVGRIPHMRFLSVKKNIAFCKRTCFIQLHYHRKAYASKTCPIML